MAATAGHRLTLDPMGKCSNMNIMRYGVNVNETTTPKSNCIRNAFFSETINQIQAKPISMKKPRFVEAHQMNIPEKLVSIVQVVSVKKGFKTFSHKVQC
jgi:hypothetical protein